MKLRARFTLWFALAALIPITLAALVTREVLSRSYREEFATLRRQAEGTVRREVDSLLNEVKNQAVGLARVEDDYIGGVLINLQKHDGVLPPMLRRQLVQRAGPRMHALSLDTLHLISSDDTVVAAPHNRALRDTVDPSLRQRVSEADGRAFFALEQIIRGDTLESVLVASAGRVVRDQDQEILVMVGREVRDRLVLSVRREGRVDARVVGADSKILVDGTEPWSSSALARVIRVPIMESAGGTVASVEIAIFDAKLTDALSRVTVVAIVLGGASLLVTVLLGFGVARRIARDLDELVAGAQAVSRDDYDHRVDVRTSDEVGEVAMAFNAMLEDLHESKSRLAMAERIAAWQEIARRLAHEIKNPLTPIQMSVETMRKTKAKNHPSFAEIFDESTLTILEETDRLKRIVSEFSEFARMPKAKKARCDLNEVVTSATALYRGSVAVQSELAERLPEVQADRDQLTQVVLNLLENARDAITSGTEGEGQLRVRTRRTAGSDAIELAVADNGPGISDAVREKLFTPYFTTKMGKGGTGLGLATVHRIVTDHGGKIRFGASDLGGAEFVVSLPTGPNPLALTFRSVRKE